jgi:hypothetical protein
MARSGRIKLPPAEAEERCAVKMSDIKRIRAGVQRFTHPIISASNWTTAFLGAAAGFAVAWTQSGHGSFNRTLFGVLALALAACGLFTVWFAWSEHRRLSRERNLVLEDMDTVVKEAPHIVTETDVVESGTRPGEIQTWAQNWPDPYARYEDPYERYSS